MKGVIYVVAVEPIRTLEERKAIANYFYARNELNNYLLIVLTMLTSFRISDIIELKICDVFDHMSHRAKDRLIIEEKKTYKRKKKKRSVLLVDLAKHAIELYTNSLEHYSPNEFLFPSRKKNSNKGYLCRESAWRIVKRGAKAVNIRGNIAPHSLRKCIGYEAQTDCSQSEISELYGHSSWKVTKAYLLIEQERIDAIYKNIKLL